MLSFKPGEEMVTIISRFQPVYVLPTWLPRGERVEPVEAAAPTPSEIGRYRMPTVTCNAPQKPDFASQTRVGARTSLESRKI